MKTFLLILLLFCVQQTNAQIYIQKFQNDSIQIEISHIYCNANEQDIFCGRTFTKIPSGISFILDSTSYMMWIPQKQERIFCFAKNNIKNHFLYLLNLVQINIRSTQTY